MCCTMYITYLTISGSGIFFILIRVTAALLFRSALFIIRLMGPSLPYIWILRGIS